MDRFVTKFQTEKLIDILELNNGTEDVLRKLTGHFRSDENVNDVDIDLAKKTSHGDTLLHRIVHATVDHPEYMEQYMTLVDMITKVSVMWWSEFQQHLIYNIFFTPPKDENCKSQLYTHLAMDHLLSKVTDSESRSVWGLAVELQSVDILRKLVLLENVMCYRRQNDKGENEMVFMLEYMLEKKNLTHYIPKISASGNKFLPVKALRKMLEMYSSYTQKAYIFMLLLHIVQMVCLSYAGLDIMDSTRIETNISTKGVFRAFGIIASINYIFGALIYVCLLIYDIYNIHKNKDMKKITVVNFCFLLLFIMFVVFLCLLLSRIDSEITVSDRYILSLTLLCGWLFTFASAAFAFESVYIFSYTFLKIISTDVLKILLAYAIFLTAFSLSMHAQFISSSNITSTYKTPIHTMYLMFNVMMGMGEAIDDQTEQNLNAANTSPVFSKILYIAYVLCCTIILFNLLIAMMNTTYSKTDNNHKHKWVATSALTGFIIRAFICCIIQEKFNYFGSVKNGLLICIPEKELEEDQDDHTLVINIQRSVSRLETEIYHTEKEMLECMKRLETEICRTEKEMLECMKHLQTQISALTANIKHGSEEMETSV